jgi:hypothetical protein
LFYETKTSPRTLAGIRASANRDEPEIRQRMMECLLERCERHCRDIGSDPVKPLFVFRSPELKTFHVKRFPENLSSTAPFSTAFEKSDCHCTCLLNIGRRGQPTHLSQKQGPEVSSSDSSFQSARKRSSPRSVSGSCSVCLSAANGTVATCASL